MNTIFKYYLRIVFLLFPIAFVPIVLDSFGFGKNLWLMGLSLIALLLWVIKLLGEKEKTIKTNKLLWLFLVFTVWSGVTLLRLNSGLRVTSLMSPMGFGTILSLLVLFFSWLQIDDKEEQNKQFLFLTISGLIVGVSSLIVFMLPAAKLPLYLPNKTDPLLSINSSWSLTGSILAEVFLLAFLVFGWLKKLFIKIKEKAEVGTYLTEAVTVAFFSLLFLLDIYRIFKLGLGILDGNSAWTIAVEVFKRNPIFGVGIGNFAEAFGLYRPASYNLTGYWANTFAGPSMGILQIWTELGIVGLALMTYLVMVVLKLKKTVNFWQTLLFLAVVLFLPLNFMSIFLLTYLLSNALVKKESKLLLNVGENNFNVMPYLVSLLMLVMVGFGAFWMGKTFLGDFYMRQSLVAASKNDGIKTYELQIKAIGINPYLASYRKIYSQTNLSLAQVILSQKEISDADKERASTLVQQAVREAKSAITLAPKSSEYWYNLAGIYRSLIGLIDGAADWSYQSYQQAIVLDPTNPILYLDIGGLSYSAGNYESADRAFEEAVKNKNNYANAWYNWANSAKKLNKLDMAVSRLEQALTLVSADSGDYETAAKELETWKKELADAVAKNKAAAEAQTSSTEPETLKTAEPIPTVSEENKVALPTEGESLQPAISPTN